jgi:branched-subunit amino acid transport protein
VTGLSLGTIWGVILAMGVLTFLIRLSFIALSGRLEPPPAAQRALRFLPAAIFAALVFPALFYPAGTLQVGLGNDRLVAGLLALLVAWRSKNILATLLGGMGALWLLQLV